MELHEVYHIAEIISKYLAGKLTAEEEVELITWRDSSDHNSWLLNDFSHFHFLERKQIAERLCDQEKAYRKFVFRQQRHLRWNRMVRICSGVAAGILLAGITVVFLYHRELSVPVVADSRVIVAGESRAVLTLANGQKVQLGKEVLDTLLLCDGTAVNASGNSVVYRAKDQSGTLVYNQLDIPRRGEFMLTLADGTKVWLNSESRIRYPMSFTGEERRVYLEGEAYFEVVKNEKMPFIVEMHGVAIRVFGTSFNARAYGDEPNVYTTLIEGSIGLLAGDKKLLLAPNEQGVVEVCSGNMVKRSVDVRLFTGWKEGRFLFDGQNLEEIMNTLVRWYDVQVFFRNETVRKVTFSGNLKRYDSFDKIIEMLELTGMAHFTVSGNTIFISE